jgi:hypothetical protein
MLSRQVIVLGVALATLLPARAPALEVWSGRTHFFAKPDSSDWTLPANQDRITDQVRLTRANNRGLFNIAQEDSFTLTVSPLDTEWATGDAVDWASLNFTTWHVWNGGVPPSMVGRDAVVHLISEDIYIDIRFESWTAANHGGGFAYTRATSPSVAVATPAAGVALAAAPNPFNPSTTLRFALDRDGCIRLAVYDSRGHLVRTLVEGRRLAGAQAVRWDGRDENGRAVAAGTYLARLQTPAQVVTTPVTLVK